MVGWNHWFNEHEFEQTLGETWSAAVHGVATDWTQLSNWTKISPHLRYLHYIKQWYIKLVLDCHGIHCCLCTITNSTSPHFTLKTALVWKAKHIITLTLYRASLVAQTVKHLSICLHCRWPRFDPWVRKIPWRRKWQPTPVLLPGKFHGWRCLVGYSPWGCKELDTTERLHFLSLDTVQLLNLQLCDCILLSCPFPPCGPTTLQSLVGIDHFTHPPTHPPHPISKFKRQDSVTDCTRDF